MDISYDIGRAVTKIDFSVDYIWTELTWRVVSHQDISHIECEASTHARLHVAAESFYKCRIPHHFMTSYLLEALVWEECADPLKSTPIDRVQASPPGPPICMS